MFTPTTAADGRTVGQESFPAVSKLLNKYDVSALLGVGPVWLMRAVERGDVPRPLLISPRGPRWSAPVLLRWMVEQGAT